MSAPSFVHVREISGGHVVSCRLCGKRVTKTFMAARTDYAEANRAAVEYGQEHEGSAAHALAVATFHSPAPETPEEDRLRAIFGQSPLTNRERRTSAARSTARRARRIHTPNDESPARPE